jgi:hypothetical protein
MNGIVASRDTSRATGTTPGPAPATLPDELEKGLFEASRHDHPIDIQSRLDQAPDQLAPGQAVQRRAEPLGGFEHVEYPVEPADQLHRGRRIVHLHDHRAPGCARRAVDHRGHGTGRDKPPAVHHHNVAAGLLDF